DADTRQQDGKEVREKEMPAFRLVSVENGCLRGWGLGVCHLILLAVGQGETRRSGVEGDLVGAFFGHRLQLIESLPGVKVGMNQGAGGYVSVPDNACRTRTILAISSLFT